MSWPLLTLGDRVGGRVTPPVRPHHRAYGSVHGGSSAPLQIPELSQQVQESPHRKQAIVHGRMHVRGPRVPPGASPGGGGLARTRSLESQCDHFATPSLRFLPLLPQDFAEAPANPLIQFVERVCHCGQATVANPSSGEPIHLVDHRTDVSSPSRVRDVVVGNHASFVDGYCLLEGKSMKALQRLSKTCPHLTMMDGTIEIIPVIEEALAAPAESA